MAFNVKEIRGDSRAKNKSGSNYVAALQASAVGATLYNVTVYVAAAADRYLWLFDAANGSPATADPEMVLVCPSGMTTKLEYGGGRNFANGIYAVLASSGTLADATTTPTAAANNDGIVTVEFRRNGV
jgi:hypothetical protein